VPATDGPSAVRKKATAAQNPSAVLRDHDGILAFPLRQNHLLSRRSWAGRGERHRCRMYAPGLTESAKEKLKLLADILQMEAWVNPILPPDIAAAAGAFQVAAFSLSVASDMSGLGSAWFVRFLNREITCCRRFGWRVYWMRYGCIEQDD
jgi:hypothetical protein